MTWFSISMVTLVDLGAVFWVAAQLWHTFLLRRTKRADQEQRVIYRRVWQRFDRFFSLPTLLVLLLANVGVLVSQALLLTGGRWDQAVVPALIRTLVANGHFGPFWIMREVIIVLAISLAVYTLLSRQRLNAFLAWANLLLGLALLLVITLSGPATTVSSDLVVSTVLAGWLHLLAAALWIGSMFYIVTAYVPVLKDSPLLERTRVLLATLPRYSLFAVIGIIVMAITSPFQVGVYISTLDQFLGTAYGRAVIVKTVLLVALLLTTVIEALLFRRRLAKHYKKYLTALDAVQLRVVTEPNHLAGFTAQQVKSLEGRVSTQSNRLVTFLRWEALVGVAILLCSSMLTIFASTLSTAQQPTTQANPFHTMVQTTDNTFTVGFDVSPNRFGPNVFTVSVLDSNGVAATNVGVSLTTTMLDMDMGTNHVTLQPDGKGHFSAQGELSMGGNWEIRILIRTSDGLLHVATVNFFTSF